MKTQTKLLSLALAVALSGATLSAAVADTSPAPTISPTAKSPENNPAAVLASVLASLVKAGTINQAQADAIIAGVKSALTPAPRPSISGSPRPSITGAPNGGDDHGMGDGPDHDSGNGKFGNLRTLWGLGGNVNLDKVNALILTTLNAAPYSLKLADTAALMAAAKGKSLAQLAAVDNGKALIAALVAFENTQIDAAASSTKLTADQIAKLKATAATFISKFVNEVPKAPKGKGGGDDHRLPPVPGASPSPSSSPSA